MKPSPLQLKWINYPAASYELLDSFDADIDTVTAAKIDQAEVSYMLDGEHMAILKISSDHENRAVPYSFSVTVVAAFRVDPEIARKEYRPSTPERLPQIVATNVARVMYSGAREYLAMITSRGTFGATVLESEVLEPSDVKIASDGSPIEIMERVFHLTPDEIAEAKIRIEALRAQQSPAPAAKKKA